MTNLTRKNVLVSQPPLAELGLTYLPIMWGILKTYWEHNSSNKERINWLQPINHASNAPILLRPYSSSTIDVLILSCYTWNWKLQCLIAQEIKHHSPDCLVIAGGPEPDYKDSDFFKKYPYIDVLSQKDGEISITKILEKVLEHGSYKLITNRHILADIPGLYLPSSDGGHLCTGHTEIPTEFPHSLYLEQSLHYEKMLRSIGPNVVVIWETNRGCPYKCSFCDWGSSTMSKIRPFPMERLKAEVDWFGRMKIGMIMLADANFGLLPRDIEITDLIVETHNKYGFPKYFTYNTAKNNPDRTLAIARKLFNSGLMSAHVLSIQHTNEAVLAATDRRNISIEKQCAVTRELMADNIPISVQLILGIPGDTYELWKTCFSDLMEWGIHGYYLIFPYNLLPNAPASDPQFMRKWEVETIERYILLNQGIRPRVPIDPLDRKAPLIVKSKTFSQQDWVRMNSYTAYIRALHNGSLTQLIAIYLRFTHNLSYRQFYEDLFENFFTQIAPTSQWHCSIEQCYEAYLKNETAIPFMDIPQFPEFDFEIEPSRWLFIQICYHLEQFFTALKTYLVDRRYSNIPLIEHVVEYQKNLIVLPSYDPNKGKSFRTDFDWVSYFSQASHRVQPAPLPEPQSTPGAIVQIRDRAYTEEGFAFPYNWDDRRNNSLRWSTWIHTIVAGHNSQKKNNFQKLVFDLQ